MNKAESLHLHWHRYINNNWVMLYGVDLDDTHFDNLNGVYIIWYFDDTGYPHIVRVGQGEIKSRLKAHRSDLKFLEYEICQRKTLFATWARVWFSDRDGVEAFLGKELRPEIGERFPDADPIEVNLPSLNLAWNLSHDFRRSYRSQANPFERFQANLYKANPFEQ